MKDQRESAEERHMSDQAHRAEMVLGHQHEACAPSDSGPKDSPSFVIALAMLPDHLKPMLRPMVDEYQFAALKVHGSRLVSPKVIAELILLGWISAEPPK